MCSAEPNSFPSLELLLGHGQSPAPKTPSQHGAQCPVIICSVQLKMNK